MEKSCDNCDHDGKMSGICNSCKYFRFNSNDNWRPKKKKMLVIDPIEINDDIEITKGKYSVNFEHINHEEFEVNKKIEFHGIAYKIIEVDRNE